jgi:hypothetical protein
VALTPKVLEPVRCQFGITNRVLDVLVPDRLRPRKSKQVRLDERN